ncbi:MAG: ABC transporter substrate-binding protein [Chloroflexota bacterium]
MSKTLLTAACVAVFALFTTPVTAQIDANRQTCITDAAPDVNYFPDQITVTDAENFTVEYADNYKVVTVTDAFDSAGDFTYVLVQCGTSAPPQEDFPDGTQFIEIPVERTITLTTTVLPHLTAIDELDSIVGVDDFQFINTTAVTERIADGDIASVGSGANINVEVVISLEPDVVLTFGFDPSTDAHPVLVDASISTVLTAGWREATPPGRAEWMKFTALFYNREAEAEAAFADIADAYDEARQLAASIPEDERPVVLWNRFSPFTGEWVIPGQETYAARLITDAGGIVALGEEAPGNSQPFSLEVVFDQAFDADIWVVNAFGVNTQAELLGQDERFADFEAFTRGDVWNNNADVNENGGNNYFELGVTNPDIILRDLVALFHPELLPDHEFVFYKTLEP